MTNVLNSCQTEITDTLHGVLDFIESTADVTSKEDLEIVFTNLVATVGQTFKAGTLSLELPIASDIEESRESEFYYYDTAYNSPRECQSKT